MDQFPQIIEQAAKSPLGIVALAMLIVGFLALVYFQKENDWRVKFGSLAFVSVGLVLAVWSVLGVSQPVPTPPPPIVEADPCQNVDIAMTPYNAVGAAFWCGTTGATRTTSQQADIDKTPSCKAYAKKDFADLTQNQLYAEGKRLAKEKKFEEAFERIDACQCHNPNAQAMILEGKQKVICHLAKG